MDQRVSMVTLGVADYARAKAFYEALGWSTAMDVQETAFFQAGGLVLVLWERSKLDDDAGIAARTRAGAGSRSPRTSARARRCMR